MDRGITSNLPPTVAAAGTADKNVYHAAVAAAESSGAAGRTGGK